MYRYSSILYLLFSIYSLETIECSENDQYPNIKLISTVFTPMNDAGDLDTSVIPAYARYMKNNGIQAVVVAGTSGEGPNLSVCEKKKLFNSWMKSGNKTDIKIIAQIGGIPLPDIIELAKYCEKLKVAGLLVLPTLYYKPADPEQLTTLMKLVSKAAPTRPIIYYDYPDKSGVNVDMAKFFNRSSTEVPEFKALKAKLPTALAVVSQNKLRSDQNIFISNYVLILAALLNGFDRFIATATNAYPELFFDIMKYTKSGDLARANIAQERLTKLTDAIEAEGGYICGLKVATGIVSGINLGDTRYPIKTITRRGKNRIREILQEYGIKVKN